MLHGRVVVAALAAAHVVSFAYIDYLGYHNNHYDHHHLLDIGCVDIGDI
jgi:hypothetical protein